MRLVDVPDVQHLVRSVDELYIVHLARINDPLGVVLCGWQAKHPASVCRGVYPPGEPCPIGKVVCAECLACLT